MHKPEESFQKKAFVWCTTRGETSSNAFLSEETIKEAFLKMSIQIRNKTFSSITISTFCAVHSIPEESSQKELTNGAEYAAKHFSMQKFGGFFFFLEKQMIFVNFLYLPEEIFWKELSRKIS